MPYFLQADRGYPCQARWLGWCAASVALFLPLLWLGPVRFLGNSDALFYSNILAFMSDSLAHGDLFPRWWAEANAGFGSPVMMFYAPLSYVVTALLNLPFAPLHPDIGKQLVFGMMASQAVSGYTSYLWLKRSFEPRIAFLCSLLFVLLPYKLVYIYLHINLAQLWALALLPLWMMAAEDMIAGDRRATGAYALLMAAVYYTHPLTLIAFGAVPALYVLWFGRAAWRRNVPRLAVAHALAALMCAMQALPGHFYLAWIHAELFFEGNYSWEHNLFHIDVILCAYYGVIAVMMGVAIHRIPSLRASAAAKQGVFWIVMLGIVLFLTQPMSAWLWRRVTPLQYLQFPAARLHAVALPGVVYLIGIWLSFYREMMPLGAIAYRRAALWVLIAGFAVATGLHVYAIEADPGDASDAYIDEGRRAKIISTPVAIYKTRWGCIETKDAFALFTHDLVPPPVSILSGTGSISSLQWNPPERIAFHADITSGNALLALRQCYIPLWKGRDGKGRAIPLAPQEDSGVIAVALGKGSHTVTVALPTSPMERMSRWIALGALIASALIAMLKDRHRRSGT